MSKHIELLRQIREALQHQDFPQALEVLGQSVELARGAGDIAAEGRQLGNMALIYYRLRQPEEALACFDKALECARADGDRRTEDGLLGNMGNILRELRRYDEAMEYLNKALLIAQEIGDTRGRGIWLSNLGLVHDDLGEPERAIELHEQSLEVARHLNDKRGLATRMGNIGNSYISRGNFARALKYFEQSVSLFDELGQNDVVAMRLGIIGNVYNRMARDAQGNNQRAYFQQALDAYGRALELARSIGDNFGEAGLLQSIGNVLLVAGNSAQAIEYFEAAYDGFSDIDGDMDERLEELRHSIAIAESQLPNANS